MSNSHRTTRPVLAVLTSLALLPFAVVVACGGDKPKVDAPPMPSASVTDTSTAAVPTDSAPIASSTTPPPPASSEPPPVEQKSKKADKKVDAAFAACHKDYKPQTKGKNLEADVVRLAKSCEKATKMKLVGKTLTGKQDAEGKPQTFPLKAEKGKCYRVYAESDPGIHDLDLAIKDSNGDIAGEDNTDDPSPIVLEDGAVCFTSDDTAVVIVSVGAGKGSYALQVWSD